MPSLNPKTDIFLGNEKISNIGSTDFPDNYANVTWDRDSFKDAVKVDIKSLSDEEIEFDLVGVDTSIANAIRRVLIAEVPTIAVASVYMLQNTSMIADEVLAQRLGLIPLKINPDTIQMKKTPQEANNSDNTIIFTLNINCEAKRQTKGIPFQDRFDMDPEDLYINHQVFSGDIEFQPFGDQKASLNGENLPKPVQDDILLAKLRPGQEIKCEMHCNKGIGRDHAKWSPVARASYRLLPLIHVSAPIRTQDVDLFRSCFPLGVVEFQDVPNDSSQKSVRIVNARKDTVSREVLRHEQFSSIVSLGRRRDHFIYNVESTGQYPSEQLLPQAIKTLLRKVGQIKSALAL